MTETNIGIDISKDHLDVLRLPGDERRRFDNSKAGHKALIQGNSDLAQRFAILCSIPGIAEVSAAMLPIGKESPSSEAGTSRSGKGFTCRPWSPSASMPISKQNTSNSSRRGKPQNRPSPPSCESSSSSQTRYSKKVEIGNHGWLDHHGYSSSLSDKLGRQWLS